MTSDRRALFHRRPFLLSLMALAATLQGCCLPPHAYTGLGRFSATCSRYLLDLGPLDLSVPGERVFEIGRLPKSGRWRVGLDVTPRPGRPAAASLREVAVAIEMTTAAGRRLLFEDRPLGQWAWGMAPQGVEGIGPAFVYSVGPEASSDPATARTAKDGLSGTFFRPVRDARYRLVVRLKAPAPGARYFEVRLQAIGSSEIGSL